MSVDNELEHPQNPEFSVLSNSENVSSNSDRMSRISGPLKLGSPKDHAESRVFGSNSHLKKKSGDLRTKSSLRIRYEAEVKIIRRKLGDLEQIRTTLGLSQRKMSQLLFVDPSAWTRWTKPGEEAPPHIYRMLQWYLALEEKYPALDTTFWLSAVAKIRAPVEDQRELEILRASYEDLRLEVQRLREDSMKNRHAEPHQIIQFETLLWAGGSFLVGLVVATLVYHFH